MANRYAKMVSPGLPGVASSTPPRPPKAAKVAKVATTPKAMTPAKAARPNMSARLGKWLHPKKR